MALDIDAIVDAVESHALASGYFPYVNGHEPKSTPTTGITAAVWVEHIGPARGSSPLNKTSVRLALFVRLYSSMMQQPADAIDPDLIKALSALFGAYTGAFTLGGLVRQVDLLGAYGDPLSARAGYLAEGDAEFRVMTITLPLILNDVWTQVA
ncbi:hypothetical protein AB0C88_37570 [Streptomyces chartreusis]|uniref:hypothetical protein n=1 Tax=Streptomyces chartreusis TaxID=1969 RepID=UPI0033FC3D5B